MLMLPLPAAGINRPHRERRPLPLLFRRRDEAVRSVNVAVTSCDICQWERDVVAASALKSQSLRVAAT